MSLATVLKQIKNHPLSKGWAGRAIAELGEALQDYIDELGETLQDYVDDEVTLSFIDSDDALTVDNDGNVAGLSSAITLANSVKAAMNVHFADETEHTAGAQEAVATADATDLTSLIALITAIITAYAAHDDDAILAEGWAYHIAQGTERALASEVAPTDLGECITRINDIKAKLNLHMADGTAHTDGDSPQEATADAAVGAAVSVAVSGALADDKVVWGVLDGGTGSVTGVSAVAGSDAVVFTFSANPQDDTIISYMVIRQG